MVVIWFPVNSIRVPITYGLEGLVTIGSVKVAQFVVSWMLRLWSIVIGWERTPVLMLTGFSHSIYEALLERRVRRVGFPLLWVAKY